MYPAQQTRVELVWCNPWKDTVWMWGASAPFYSVYLLLSPTTWKCDLNQRHTLRDAIKTDIWRNHISTGTLLFIICTEALCNKPKSSIVQGLILMQKNLVLSPEELKPGSSLGWSFLSLSSLLCSWLLSWHMKAVNSVMQFSSGKEVEARSVRFQNAHFSSRLFWVDMAGK